MFSSVGQRVDSLRQINLSYRQARQCIRDDSTNDFVMFYKESHTEHVVESVKTYIRDNLGKHLSLQEVAAVFNFNPNYLSHLFAKYAGTGFVDYITAVRISAAKELLAQDTLRIYEIAEQLGFENAFYFSKVFKKAEGLSPSEYIHKNR
jgi:two-component system response regulator YesN